MKNLIKVFGIIVLVAVIVFSTIACSKKAVAQESSKTGSVKSADKETPESDFTVTLTSDNAGVIIKEYKGTAEIIRIPATIQGLPVREIGETSLRRRNYTSITIPEGVTIIGNSAFASCEKLSSVSLPSTLESIGSYVFYDCTALVSIALPSGLTKIGVHAFEFTGLTSFPKPWPKAVTIISEGAFTNSKLSTVVIPEGVTKIEREAFCGCKDLTSVSLPSTISSINHFAFTDCISLTTVNIPESVTSINFEGSSHFRRSSKVNLASQARLKQLGYKDDF